MTAAMRESQAISSARSWPPPAGAVAEGLGGCPCALRRHRGTQPSRLSDGSCVVGVQPAGLCVPLRGLQHRRSAVGSQRQHPVADLHDAANGLELHVADPAEGADAVTRRPQGHVRDRVSDEPP